VKQLFETVKYSAPIYHVLLCLEVVPHLLTAINANRMMIIRDRRHLEPQTCQAATPLAARLLLNFEVLSSLPKTRVS